MTKIYNLLERVNNLLLKLKKNKVYHLSDSQVGINIGCEHNTPSKYTGIDGSPLIWISKNSYLPAFFKKIIFSKTCTSNHLTFAEFMKKANKIQVIHHNLLYGIPFNNNSISNIFSSHFLEHLTGEQAVKLLKECNRVLKSGGVLRIIVPSLDDEVVEMKKVIAQYGKDGNVEKLQKYLTVDTDTDNHNSFSFHRKMYNFNELKSVLKLAGFDKIKKKKRWQGEIKNVSALDVRDGLIVEAYKRGDVKLK